MEICRVGVESTDDKKVEVVQDNSPFVIDEIYPLSIRPIGNGLYMVFFVGKCSASEEKIFINTPVRSVDNIDFNFLNSHPLNINKITADKKRLAMYIEFTKESTDDDVYVSDFDMSQDIMQPVFYTFTGSRKDSETQVTLKKVLINKECFIRINLFFVRLKTRDVSCGAVFFDHKLKNIKLSKVEHIKLDGSGTDISSSIVCSHYTSGNGPEFYKFNFISIKIPGAKLKMPLSSEVYERFYSEDFTVSDMFYDFHSDSIFVLYEVRSDITNSYKETKALIFPRELYEKTNFVNPEFIYEIDNKKETAKNG